MSTKIYIKKSSLPGKIPSVSDLEYGELALNYADGKLYYKTTTNTIDTLGGNLSASLIDTSGITSSEVTDLTKLTFAEEAGFKLTTIEPGVVKIGLDITPSPLVFTTSGDYRILTSYIEGDTTYVVRTAEFVSNKLRLTLAGFTPTFSSAPLPSSSLSWDVPCTGFSVSVTNPTDFTDKWISEVASITGSTGIFTPLVNYTANSKSATPAGGVSWTQTFSTDADSYIRPNVSSGISGGSASATVRFNASTSSSTQEYTTTTASWTVTWATPSVSMSVSSLSGNTFLQTYASVPYTVSVSGMSSTSNYVNVVTPTGGTISNTAGSGTFTFSVPVHKDNTGTTRSLSLTTTFTRPASVTGSSYTAQATASASVSSVSFSYPSYWLFTVGAATPPARTDIISGSGIKAGVTALGDQVKTFSGFVTNPSSNPQAFWLAVRSSASQPTTFKTGASAGLLSDVATTQGNSVNLAPDSPPAGYSAVSYNLYGIILQPGSTYVSIS